MYIKRTENKHGTGESHHVCDTCGSDFTITPAVEPDSHSFDNCLAEGCDSYDPDRDIEPLFMTDKEIAREKKIVSMDVLRKRRTQ